MGLGPQGMILSTRSKAPPTICHRMPAALHINQIEFKPLASVSHCNAIIFLQHKIRDLLRPRVADTKEERFLLISMKMNLLIFPEKKKKKKGKHT